MLGVVRKEPCPECRKNGLDKTGDNLNVYDNGGKYCFACTYTEHSPDYKEEPFEETMEDYTEEEHAKLKSRTTLTGKGLRGIRDETYRYFGVRHQLDKLTEDPIRQFYPITINDKLSGYKVRTLPKTFSAVGTVGKDCDFFGQFRFRNVSGNSKYVLIVGGEIDQLSAFQMLQDYRLSKNNDYGDIPVVSPVTGETGSVKQLQKQYEWLSQFEKIILCFDNDEAGHLATEKAVKVLPKGKVYVMDLPLKDANEMMVKGRHKEFLNLFFKAHKYTPVGVLGSDQLYDKVLEHIKIPKIPLPGFMHELSNMTAGGFPLGRIINLAAASGVGKSSFVNELIYFWIFNSPHQIGVVSLESDAGEYGEIMLSRHIGQKIALIEDMDEKLEFVLSKEDEGIELFIKEDGSPRWQVVDDRDGDLKSLQNTIEELIVACECKVIVLDPIQDVLDGMSNEEQAVFMKWQKSMVKSHNVTFININHIRKSGDGKESGSAGAFITEEAIQGSSTLYKSAAANIMFTRNKYAEDPVEQNTTKAIMSKCRWTGRTGVCGHYYYDNETHTLHDYNDWIKHNPQVEEDDF